MRTFSLLNITRTSDLDQSSSSTCGRCGRGSVSTPTFSNLLFPQEVAVHEHVGSRLNAAWRNIGSGSYLDLLSSGVHGAAVTPAGPAANFWFSRTGWGSDGSDRRILGSAAAPGAPVRRVTSEFGRRDVSWFLLGVPPVLPVSRGHQEPSQERRTDNLLCLWKTVNCVSGATFRCRPTRERSVF